MKKIFFLTLSFALVGCAQHVWVKPGGTNDDFARDRYACLQTSQQSFSRSSAVNTGGISAVGVTTASSVSGSETNLELVDACMNSKGWRLRDKESLTQAKAERSNESLVRTERSAGSKNGLQVLRTSSKSIASNLPLCVGTNVRIWNDCIGTVRYPNGNIYAGEYKSGKRDGWGTIQIFAIGVPRPGWIAAQEQSVYRGEFKNDMINGWGVITSDSGKVTNGKFKNNVLIK